MRAITRQQSEKLAKPRSKKCEYCDKWFEIHASTTSSINRHLRNAANLPEEKRGNHPKKDTVRFELLVREQKFKNRYGGTIEGKEAKKKFTAASKKISHKGAKERISQGYDSDLLKLR
jgi:hypothetical protein